MMSTAVSAAPAHGSPAYPASLIVISTILYAGFAFVTTIVALNIFWPAGLALGIVLGWRGGFIPGFGQTPGSQQAAAVQSVAPAASAMPSSGNASFDAYRAEMLTRLEKEQDRFEGFLGRLREAKDKSEFDRFMDDRAARTRPASHEDQP